MSNDVLTLNRARQLAKLITAVDGNKRLTYYPDGTNSADNPASMVLRNFTYEGGGFWPHDADIRDAFVHCSGIFERWFPVNDLLDALSNVNGDLGLTNPIATIDER